MPNADGSVHLPFDVPPGARAHLGPTNVAGLITHASVGVGAAPVPLYTSPWNPWESMTFPKVEPSHVAPDELRPKWGVAINAYSPIAHRSALTTTVPPKAISARGVAVPTQRPRGYAAGYVTAWPQIAPRWPSFGEAPRARGG